MSVDDAPAVQEQFERFEVVRYLNKSVPWPYPQDGARFYLENVLGPAVESGKEQAWAIVLQGKLIGSIGLTAEGDENRGFWLAPEHWGHGYMAEASDRITDYALRDLGWSHLTTGNAVPNLASSRIKQSQGFQLIATLTKEFVGGAMEYEQWRLTRQEWLRRHRHRPSG
jgi:RimJ/RimL family protein N-acetyltransferase